MKYVLLLLKITLIALFIKAALTATDEEFTAYEFYEMLRWIVLGTFSYFAWNSYKQKNMGFVIVFLLGALMFNPLKPFDFEEETWQKVDCAFAFIVALSILFDFNNTSSVFKPGNQIVLSKSAIRREVKFIVVFAGMWGVLWIFVQIATNYYQKRISNDDTKKIEVQAQINALPNDYVWELYKGFRKRLMEEYLVGEDTFEVSREHNGKFLRDYPFAVKQEQSQDGYKYWYPHNHFYIYTGYSLVEIEALRVQQMENPVAYKSRYDNGATNGNLQEITDPLEIFDFDNHGYVLDKETNQPKPNLLLYNISYAQFQSNLRKDDYKEAVKYFRSNYDISDAQIEKGLGYTSETPQQKHDLEMQLANLSSEQYDYKEKLDGRLGQDALLVTILLYAGRLVFLFTRRTAKKVFKDVKSPIKLEA